MSNALNELRKLTQMLCDGKNKEVYKLYKRLKRVGTRRKLNLNHSAMEILLGKYLIDKGYKVTLERCLVKDNLISDVYARNGKEILMVEVETGYVGPNHALVPVKSRIAKDIAKIIKYSPFSDKFGLAFPPFYVSFIPEYFFHKDSNSIERIKLLLEEFYPNLELERIKDAHLEKIYVINVDELRVKEFDATEYVKILEPLKNLVLNEIL